VSAAEPPDAAVPPASGAVGRCPACGGPLYGWLEAPASDARRQETYILDRCEDCGLGLVREGELDPRALIAAGRSLPDGRVEIRAANRRSVQATLGEGRWAGLGLPRPGFALTPQALIAALDRAGYEIERLRVPVAARNQGWMWQTLLNALTLQPNFAREALAGRVRPARSARARAAFLLDALVSVLATPLVAIVALPLETAAALARRGGILVATARPRAIQASSRTKSASGTAASS
jgi:hypothetical protein